MSREWVRAWIAAAVLLALAIGATLGVGVLVGGGEDSDVIALLTGIVFGSIAMNVWIGWWRP